MYGVILPVILWLSAVVTSADSVGTRVEPLIAPHASAGHLSGVVLIAKDDQILFHRAYGLANQELGVPNTTSSRFGIGSISKLMTQIVVGQLAGEGQLDLASPVETYLPNFPKGPNGNAPTVQHLLEHRAGVPHRVTTPRDELWPSSAEEIVQRVRDHGLLFEPGSRRLYSSAGYSCLAHVVEIVTGKSYETVVSERIFAPAAMESTVAETGQRVMAGRARSHRLGIDEGRLVVKNTPPRDLRFLTGAGSLYSTADDLLRFVTATRRGTFGASAQSLAKGAGASKWRGWTGRTDGYEASIDILPAEGLVFVFLSNLRSAANWQVREQTKRVLVGLDPESIPFPPPVASSFEPPTSVVGTYGSAVITYADGALFRGGNEFYPIADDRYYVPASATTMRFSRNAKGAVDALVTIRGDGRETTVKRSPGRAATSSRSHPGTRSP